MTSTITIDDLRDDTDAHAFRRLNEEWIGQYFALEAEDRRQLEDPVGQLVSPGGAVLVARLGDEVVGCVALAVTRPGVMDLVKMAVSPDHQGHGIGRSLVAAALDRARELGATRLELESNRRLASAVHLYEQHGFRHLGADEHEPGPYARADVAMALDL
ncbi:MULTISPECIES: GNAT family N-acetyltransferase [unclassified Nocardioides]|uniref:GNAT family N-acetyltransferase n=1 Tax=unclassified Nocardioides TaxID=2615069 RepID=UPI00301465D6